MEDVLAVYTRPYDARFPVICMDEGGKVLHAQVCDPIPMKPGQPMREDYQYDQQGASSIFLAVEPLAGRRTVEVKARRTKADWAHFLREVIDVQYPTAEKIVLVMDNLNTHSPASFYEAFPPEEAWRLAQKLEIHHTPIHGSWLNMAEIELSVLARQALSERIATLPEVQRRVAVWNERRDQRRTRIDWRFTTADARIKLKHLYPQNEP